MSAQPERHPREPDTSRLLDAYVAASRRGGGAELRALLAGAGPRAAELRERLEVLGLLELAMRLFAEHGDPRRAPLRFPLPRE